jgi:hypothetical protein
MNASAITKQKSYPADYPQDAINILQAMELQGGNIHLVGSMSLRSQQYAGDYDGYEIVNHKGSIPIVVNELVNDFQTMIDNLRRLPNVYIGDIKSGVIDDWRVIPRTAKVNDDKIKGYNSSECRNKVQSLLQCNIISQDEAKEALGLLKDNPTVPEFLMAKKLIKFHTIRWTVLEVLKNQKQLRNGTSITLQDTFQTKGITKVDVIGLVNNNRYTDFSVIYEFRCNGKTLNPEPVNIRSSLEEDILAYLAEGNYFKVLKRGFALAKLLDDSKTIIKLNPVLNSDLGRLYNIVSDIDTLIRLLDEPNVKLDRIQFEIDQFKQRLSNIYTIKDYLKKDDKIVKQIKYILTLSKEKLKVALERLSKELDSILQNNSRPIVEELRLG